MLDIIILLALAIFFITRLRKVLGMKVDEDPSNFKDKLEKQFGKNEKEKVVVLRRGDIKDDDKIADIALEASIQNETVKQGIKAIREADKDFSLESFMEGSKAAFEMILTAYNERDKETLKPLLSKEVMTEFEENMAEDDKDDISEDNTLVAIQTAEITEATLEGRKAVITVQYVSEQISVKRNKLGDIVEGDPSETELVTDEWSFSRDIRSSDPNWLLVSV